MTALRKLLKDYLDHRRSLGYSPRSLEEYRYDCGGFLDRLEESRQVRTPDQLRRERLLDWRRWLDSKRNREGLPLHARTLNKNISAVRNFLEFLAKRGFVHASLPEALENVKEPSFLPMDALPHRRIRSVLAKIDVSAPRGHRDRTILEVLYSTGIRASELCGIRLRDVDLANGMVKVTGKGNKQRMVPLGRTARRFMETHLRAVRAFLVEPESGDAVFLDDWGTPMRRHTLLKLVHRRFDGTAEFPVTPHTFRRSCATEMIRAGANLYHVKELLGHETLDTVRHYAKLTVEDLRKTHAKCHPRERDR